MTQTCTMPSMTDRMDPVQLVGYIVREGITDRGLKFTAAAARWHISLPTLNRLMSGEKLVGARFLRIAEKQLDLPYKLLDMVLDRDIESIREVPGLDERLRTEILTELGAEPPAPRRRKRA